jgi:ribosomal protein L40E
MQCAQCQQENPPQAKFCLECGTRLILMCGQCDTELPAGAKFCLECGQPVSGQPAPLTCPLIMRPVDVLGLSHIDRR